jgi:serine phosphatase RsbU (regulator of sigma subunit)
VALLAQEAGTGPSEASPALLARISLGVLLASAGATALLLAAIYRSGSRLTLTAFGLFSWFYGSLILLQAPAIADLLGLSPLARAYVIVWISYFVPGLGMLYAEQTRGRGWFSLLRIFWRFGLTLAVLLVAFDIASGRPAAAFGVYQVFLFVAMLVLLPHVVIFKSEDRVERLARAVGTGMLASTLLIDMVSGYFSIQAGFDTFGIAFFVLAQGVVTARQFFHDQRELAAVERELETARAIQAAILPAAVPSVAGLSIALRYLPAHSVAGDVYDFVRTDDHHLGILVADVAGHGVSAALIASMTTVAFASQRAHAADTARTLAEINRVLCGHFDTRYVTAAYAFIDTQTRVLRYSIAGHPPPLLWRAASRQIERLSEASTVLGLLEQAAYSAATVVLEPGDRLILYTDGLTDVAGRNDVFFGDTELAAFVAAHATRPPAEFIDALIAHLSAWSYRAAAGSANGAPRFDDDLTVVVVDLN